MSTTPPNAPTRGAWTAEDLDSLGLVIDVETAASVLGIGRTTAYQLIREDAFPVPVIRLGSRLRVPVQALRQLLAGVPGPTDPVGWPK